MEQRESFIPAAAMVLLKSVKIKKVFLSIKSERYNSKSWFGNYQRNLLMRHSWKKSHYDEVPIDCI